MMFALIIMYVITLVYLPITERFRDYATLIMVQGCLLFGIALLRLHTINIFELLFVLAETLIFKAIIVPKILHNIIKKTGINRIESFGRSQFGMLAVSILALIGSIAITYYIADKTVDMIFFGVALYALISGLLLITARKRIFSHLVGFLVIENGVFLFSMAIGVEMPFLVNIAILLDILMSVLLLGLFLTKLGDKMHALDSDSLTTLKD